MNTSPIATTVWVAEDRRARIARFVLLTIGGSLLLTLSAKFKVDFWPVPMTMQTFVVLLIGMTFGWRLAGATVLLYLAEGAFGLPVFTNTPEKGIGIAYMVGPTGGYLLGFALAALAVGWLAERGWTRPIWRAVLLGALGMLLIYIPGYIWLATLIGSEKAWQFGVAPFLLGDCVKILLAAAVVAGLSGLAPRLER